MRLNHLFLALQFLTRLPVPSIEPFDARELSRSAAWFPFVGILIGGFVAAAAFIGFHVDAWLGALLALVMWIWITGGLHLDGLADLADALGASHRDSERFLAVLRDPHIGTFGVLALIVATAAKLILIVLGLRAGSAFVFAIPLIAAWARWGSLVWSNTLPALSAGQAERFAWHKSTAAAICWCCGLLLSSAALAPALLCAPLVVLGWRYFLQARVGGMTGDCLGAGIEVTESVLLLAFVSAQGWNLARAAALLT
jgi:adenosylcobinamide-GDP ribazoletransferase